MSGHCGPDPVTGILNVLLDLALLPAESRITELGLEQVVADHRGKASVDVAQLAAADLVHGGLHVVVDATVRHATEHGKGVLVSIEQHLMRLQGIGYRSAARTLGCGSA